MKIIIDVLLIAVLIAVLLNLMTSFKYYDCKDEGKKQNTIPYKNFSTPIIHTVDPNIRIKL